MLVDPSNSTVGSAVTGAIRQASQATGTSFNYLLATAQVESGLNPQAGAATSSARGLFQFIEHTWLGTIKESGAALGYGRYAAAITKTSSGHYQVTDPAMRSEILKLRNDPTANAVMAGAFTKTNADILTKKLGRPPSEGELYIAHFLGVGGAARLISLAANNPTAKASDYFPTAANANSSIFYDRSTGAARSLAQVRNILTARYDVAARMRPGDSVRTAQAASVPVSVAALPAVAATPRAAVAPTVITPAVTAARSVTTPPRTAADKVAATAPDTAGIANAYAAAVPALPAQNNQIFHGLFQDTDRTAPVAAIVSQLWSLPNAVPGANKASGQHPDPAGMRDLFKDSEAGS